MFSGYDEGEEERLFGGGIVAALCPAIMRRATTPVSGVVWERPGAGRESVTNPPCNIRSAHGIFVKSLV